MEMLFKDIAFNYLNFLRMFSWVFWGIYIYSMALLRVEVFILSVEIQYLRIGIKLSVQF